MARLNYSDLKDRLNYLNNSLGLTTVDDMYYISAYNNGYAVCDASGRCVLACGYNSLRIVYDCLQSYIDGIERGKVCNK